MSERRTETGETAAEWFATVREWMPRILRQHTVYDGNWNLNRHQRIAYTAKAVACLLLNRERVGRKRLDGIVVAMGDAHRRNHPEFGDAADWEEFLVPYGWDVWGFTIASEGYP